MKIVQIRRKMIVVSAVRFHCLCHSATIKKTTVDVRLPQFACHSALLRECITVPWNWLYALMLRRWVSQIRFWSRHFFSLARRALARSLLRSPRATRWKFLSSRTARPCFSLRLLINPRLNPIHPASSRDIFCSPEFAIFWSKHDTRNTQYNNNNRMLQYISKFVIW